MSAWHGTPSFSVVQFSGPTCSLSGFEICPHPRVKVDATPAMSKLVSTDIFTPLPLKEVTISF